uniref:S-adenosyl-L-methionine-dependent methyltransferases superfamily protein n=1 Tax=Davidia involucrata TaxID=16924 RepID=A0A5B6YUK6_DAVIN
MVMLADLVLPPGPVLLHRGPHGIRCCFSHCTRTSPLPLPPPPLTKEVLLCCKTRYSTPSSNFSFLNEKPNAVQGPAALGLAEEEEDDDDEQDFQVVTAVRSNYNDIMILDTPKSRMLLLDSTHNVHSIFNKGQKWTGSYWDEFASLPAIVPKGPIAIFGLGGGTAAHLMLELWPSLQLDGWEIDEILIDKARDYLGLSDLEKHTQASGILRVHVGDALSSSVNVPGGYAGIIIDLFSDGKVLPQLEEVATWFELNDKLMPNGRLMVNCGAANDGASNSTDTLTHPQIPSVDGTWVQNSTIKALCEAFPGQLSWKKMPKRDGENYLALTGPLPDFTTWSAVLPDQLCSSVKQWRPCSPL